MKKVLDTRNSLQTDRLDMSFGEIMNIYVDEDLIINPEFQRLFRWSNEQQTSIVKTQIYNILFDDFRQLILF